MRSVLLAGGLAGVAIAGIILYMGRSKRRRKNAVPQLNGHERNMMYSMG